MSDFGVIQQHLSTIEMDGRPCAVSVRIAYDGIEYIGRLFFADPETGDGIPDHGAIPGRTVEEAIEFARRLNLEDFTRRYHRARADKRRYTSLRKATDEMLMKIKYMNRVSINMRNGLLDNEGARQEIELIQKQLHDMIERLPACRDGGVRGTEHCVLRTNGVLRTNCELRTKLFGWTPEQRRMSSTRSARFSS